MAAKKKIVKKKPSSKKNTGKKNGEKAAKKTVTKKKAAGVSTKKTGKSKKTTKKDKGLTPKQMAAVCAYIENGGNKSEAYRTAYDAENMSVDTVKVEASRLFSDPNIALTVFNLQEEHRERHNVTVDSLTNELEEARDVSKEEGQGSGMVSATMGKAKLHGLITDKNQLLGKDGKPIDPNAPKEPWIVHLVRPGDKIPKVN